MNFSIDKIFTPSCGIDLVFNLNSLTPYSRSSIIYDTDHDRRLIVVAQPNVKITRNTEFKELHITTISSIQNKKIRLGLICVIDELIQNYSLANKSQTGAVVLKYTPPAKETNIRAAFRLSLGGKFAITGKMICQDQDFFTPNDFTIRDISLNGIGMVVPRKSPLLHTVETINLKDELVLGLILIDQEENKPIGTVPVTANITRINKNYSDSHLFIGCRFTGISSETDALLNQFIHTAQIDELRRISGI